MIRRFTVMLLISISALPGPALAWPLAVPRAEPPPRDGVAKGARSEDGSAELGALRGLTTEETLGADAVAADGQRGLELEYGVALDDSAAGREAPTLVAGEEAEVVDNAALVLIVRRGRRRLNAGWWIAFAGVLAGPSCMAAAIGGARDEDDDKIPVIVLSTVSVVGFGLLAVGIGLAVRGNRMMKNPANYVTLRRPAPGRSGVFLAPGAGGVTLHF